MAKKIITQDLFSRCQFYFCIMIRYLLIITVLWKLLVLTFKIRFCLKDVEFLCFKVIKKIELSGIN